MPGALAAACLAFSVVALARAHFAPSAVLVASAAVLASLAPRPLRAVEIALIAGLTIAAGYQHAIYFERAARGGSYDLVVQRIGEAARPDLPLAVDDRSNRLIQLSFYLESTLHRPVYDRGNVPSLPYYWITPFSQADSTGRTVLSLPYPRRKIGTIVMQEVPGPRTEIRPGGAAAPASARQYHERSLNADP